MANLTANATLRFRQAPVVEKWNADSSAAQTIYKGQPVIIDASADTVNVRGWVSTITLVSAADIRVGIALEKVDVAAGDTETDRPVQIATRGEVGFKSSVFTKADIGKYVGMSDSATLTTTVKAGAADKCPLGKLVNVEDGYAYVLLDPDGPNLLAF